MIINLGEKFSVERSRLRTWCSLEDIRETLQKAVENNDIDSLGESVIRYLSTAISQPIDFENIPWHDTATAFLNVAKLNRLEADIPMLQIKEGKEEAPVWDYPGRNWYFWLNIFAEAYGWGADQVAELDVEEAVKLYQEIMISLHNKREWEWSLSEIAYGYNKTTKQSEYREYPKPKWMTPTFRGKKPSERKVKIRKDMMPLGNVIRWSEELGKEVLVNITREKLEELES